MFSLFVSETNLDTAVVWCLAGRNRLAVVTAHDDVGARVDAEADVRREREDGRTSVPHIHGLRILTGLDTPAFPAKTHNIQVDRFQTQHWDIVLLWSALHAS